MLLWIDSPDQYRNTLQSSSYRLHSSPYTNQLQSNPGLIRVKSFPVGMSEPATYIPNEQYGCSQIQLPVEIGVPATYIPTE